MPPVGTAVKYIDHGAIPKDALIIAHNANNSADLLIISDDKKKQARLTSADWPEGCERKMGIEHIGDRLHKVATDENAKAKAEERDAKPSMDDVLKHGAYWAADDELITDKQTGQVRSFDVDRELPEWYHHPRADESAGSAGNAGASPESHEAGGKDESPSPGSGAQGAGQTGESASSTEPTLTKDIAFAETKAPESAT